METNTSSYALQSVSGFEKMNVLILGNSGAGKSTIASYAENFDL